MDQSTNLSQPISDIEPKMIEPEVVKQVKPKYTLTIVFAIIILGLLGFLTYAFLTGKLDIGIKSPLIFEEEEKSDSECTECEVCENCTDSSYVLKNSGWALYDLNKYEFSVELPTYTMTQDVDDNDVVSLWKVEVGKTDTSNSTFYTDYLDTIYVKFLPDDVSMFACGGGCANEHFINVDVFKNTGSKSLSEISNTYFANLESDAEDNGYEPIITKKDELKWGLNVISFTEETPSNPGLVSGNIIVTPKFVYAIRYYLSSTPAESNAIAEKVLDSFEFGE